MYHNKKEVANDVLYGYESEVQCRQNNYRSLMLLHPSTHSLHATSPCLASPHQALFLLRHVSVAPDMLYYLTVTATALLQTNMDR